MTACRRVPLGDARGKEVDICRRKAILLFKDGAEGARHHRLHRQTPAAEISHSSGRVRIYLVLPRPLSFPQRTPRWWKVGRKREVGRRGGPDAQEEVNLSSVAVFCDSRGSRGCMCLGGDLGSLGSATESTRAPRCLAGRVDIRERSDLRVPCRQLRVPNHRDGGPQAGMGRLLQRSVRRKRPTPLARPRRRLPPLTRSRRRPPPLARSRRRPPPLARPRRRLPPLAPCRRRLPPLARRRTSPLRAQTTSLLRSRVDHLSLGVRLPLRQRLAKTSHGGVR